MHIHVFPKPILENEGDWSYKKLTKNFSLVFKNVKDASTKRGLIIILDTNFLKNKKAVRFLEQNRRWFHDFPLCFMFDFRDKDQLALIKKSKELGGKAIKFHPYLQKISEKDFLAVEQFAKIADKLALCVVIDCSYGTRNIYDYTGIKLAGYLADKVKVPIIMAHGGGMRVFDAMLVAMDSKNIFLDTSFSLFFWQASSVEEDFAYAIRKLGPTRWMYGSDTPWVSSGDSLKTIIAFFKRYRFSKEEIDSILFRTANNILNSK